MKRTAFVLMILTLFPLVAAADVSKEDIRKLVENKISDRVILAFIRANRPVRQLSSDDILELKKWGASDAVVEALLDSSSKPAPKPETKPRTVYVAPATTTYYRDYYYYPYRTYYYPSWSWYGSSGCHDRYYGGGCGSYYYPSWRFQYASKSGRWRASWGW